MTKTELADDLARENNGRRLITQAAVMRYWGRSKASVRELLKDVPHDCSGRDYKYHVKDVAEKLLERMVM